MRNYDRWVYFAERHSCLLEESRMTDFLIFSSFRSLHPKDGNRERSELPKPTALRPAFDPTFSLKATKDLAKTLVLNAKHFSEL